MKPLILVVLWINYRRYFRFLISAFMVGNGMKILFFFAFVLESTFVLVSDSLCRMTKASTPVKFGFNNFFICKSILTNLQ